MSPRSYRRRCSDRGDARPPCARRFREALDFDKVLIQLTRARGRAAAIGGLSRLARGRHGDGRVSSCPRITRLFDPEFEIAGCYLVPHEEAERRVGREPGCLRVRPATERACSPGTTIGWSCPSTAPTKNVRGVLWADEPRNPAAAQPRMSCRRSGCSRTMRWRRSPSPRSSPRRSSLADHDPLTPPARTGAPSCIDWPQASRSRRHPLALVFLDLDNFKEVNDGHGHAVGDRVLARFSSLLAELVPGSMDVRSGSAATSSRCCWPMPANRRRASSDRPRPGAHWTENIDPLLRVVDRELRHRDEQPPDGAPTNCCRLADEAMYHGEAHRPPGIEVADPSAESQGGADVVGLPHVALAGALRTAVPAGRRSRARSLQSRSLSGCSASRARELTLMLNGEACLVSEARGRAPARGRRLRLHQQAGGAGAQLLPRRLPDHRIGPREPGEVCSISADDPGRRCRRAVRAPRDGDAGGPARPDRGRDARRA